MKHCGLAPGLILLASSLLPIAASAQGTGDELAGVQAAAAAKPAPPSPQRTRPYFAIRYGRSFVADSDIASGFEMDQNFGQEQISGSVGFNWGRYLGLEIAMDYYEVDIDNSSAGKIAEYSVLTTMPQVRLRYPLMNDRLTPYVVGGAGVSFTQFNDRNSRGAMPGVGDITGEAYDLAFGVGAGLEYFIADNVALGFEVKYLTSDADITANGVGQDADLDAFLITAGARLFYPGLPYSPPAEPTSGGGFWDFDYHGFRPYAGLGVGIGFFLADEVTSGFEAEMEALLTARVGVDFNRHIGAELVVDQYATHITFTDLAKVAEYTFWVFTPQLRLRYPLLQDRLVPYLVGGAGVVFSEVNDRTALDEQFDVPRFSGQDLSPVFSAGGGVEYFIADNMALGLEARYLYNRPDVKIDGRDVEANFDSLLVSTGIRFYF